MSGVSDWAVRWGATALSLLAGGTLAFGLFSARSPQRSIALYQWLMARFNWRVNPIDERREQRTTRLLGILLVGLSLFILWHLTTITW